MRDLEGRTALITGGSRGMGRMLADRFARDGAKVVLWARTQADLDTAVGEICEWRGDAGAACSYPVDVADPAAVMEAAKRVKEDVGPVDVLVNNAGIVHGGTFLEVTVEEHKQTMDVNFNAMMWTIKAFLPDMVERNEGHIINMSSGAGLTYIPLLTSYCASKSAIINFTDSLRLEMKMMGIDGVKCTIVCPGFVKTGMFDGVKPPAWLPWLEPEKIADRIYAAYRRGELYVAEPAMGRLAPLFRAFTPRRSLDFFQAVSGLSRSMDEWVGHNR